MVSARGGGGAVATIGGGAATDDAGYGGGCWDGPAHDATTDPKSATAATTRPGWFERRAMGSLPLL